MAYLGNAPGVESQRLTTTFTATDGQTAFNPVGGYTLGYVDVYLNGVKLIDGTDYTADDGVTVTLSVGASLNDNVEIVTYTPRGLSDGYTKSEADVKYATKTAFTSTGIDDNATSTAITIDSNENVLVGKTTTNLGTAGTTLWNDGRAYISRTSGAPIIAERLSTDGDIASFFKDGTTVGSIGSFNGVPYIGYSGAGGGGIMFNGTAINPTGVGSTRTDGTNDIGASAFRFKDLYLSGEAKVSKVVIDDTNGGDLILSKNGTGSVFIGEQSAGLGSGDGLLLYGYGSGTVKIYPKGVNTAEFTDAGLLMSSGKGIYLGGTGSANKLDDYEEGTFTPSGNWTGASTFNYTKIGNLVTIEVDLQADSTGGSTQFSLPFTVARVSATGIYTSAVVFPSSAYTAPTAVAAGSILYFRAIGNSATFSALPITANGYVHFSLTYETNA